jgi:hypothetical protein
MLTGSATTQITIDRRYAGIPGIALGGYSSGLIATALETAGVEVRLRRPVPTGRPLALEHAAAGIELRDGDTLLAEGSARDLAIEVPRAPTLWQAEAASVRFPGHHGHPYGECFACGPDREHGDGLRIFPGAVEGRPLLAAPWTPAGDANGGARVGLELIWSAFDCAQLWALIVHQPGGPGERAVTVALAGAQQRPVRPGLPHVVIGWPLPRRGDSLRAGAAVIDPDGQLCAVGLQTAVIANWGVPLDFMRRRPSDSPRT